MLLLWPDTPRVHTRRLRFKALVHAHPEATARGPRSRRVGLLPVVPPIRRGSVEAPPVRASSGPEAPAAPTVFASPTLAATRVDVGPPARTPAASALAGWAAVPAVRSAPASSVGLRTPTALRRMFARPLGPPFLSDRSPESDLLFLLSSATMSTAARAQQALLSRGLGGATGQLVARVADLALGRHPLAGFWGDHPCVDALRLRLARGGPPDDVLGRIGLEGFYAWAGRRIGPEELARVPSALVPDAAAAVAAVSGYRRAFDLVAGRATAAPPSDEVLGTIRLLALRCALSGSFFPALVRFLVPPLADRLEPKSHAAWEPALLALHAYRLAGHEAGATHVAAAVVATAVRDQVGRIAGRSEPSYRPREWGTPAPAPEVAAEHRRLLAYVGVLLGQLWWTYEPGWPAGWGAPDPVQVERRVAKALGESGGPVYDVFLDDALALAACHALLGHTPSALAALAASRTPDTFAAARDRLARALQRGAFERTAAPVVDTALARDFQGRLDRLLHTPDPAEFASPDWRRPELRGRLLSRLQEKGPRGQALALRTVLGKDFDELDRFWLAPIAPRRTALLALAAWLDRRAPVVPTDRDCLLFLDEQCRETGS